MKPLHRLFATSLLIITLSPTAFAGEMSTTVAPPQPATGATVVGVMSTTATADDHAENEEASVVVPVTEAALSVLQSVLALL